MGRWDSFAVCPDPCGYFEEVAFGDLRHVHASVCPRCGRDTGYWKLVVGRRRGFLGSRLEVKDDA